MKEDLRILMLSIRTMSTTVDNCPSEGTVWTLLTYRRKAGVAVPAHTSRHRSDESNSR